MQGKDDDVIDLGAASLETKGPAAQGLVELMGYRSPTGITDD